MFDEAHHLTAYRQNGKLVKTQNFKLAEMLKEHTRDLVLLSATPHQGQPPSECARSRCRNCP